MKKLKKYDEYMYIAYSKPENGEQIICWADSIEELAQKMNVSIKTIYRHLKNNDGQYAKILVTEY